MTPEEYLRKLEEFRRRAERAVIEELPSMERYAYDLITQWVDDNVDVKNGRLVYDERVLLALNNFVDQYLGAFTQSQVYTGPVSSYLKEFKPVGDLMQDFQRSQGLPVQKANLNAVHEVVVNEIINRFSENGLNAGFVQPLRSLLFNNITGGLNKTQALGQLRDFIESGKDTTGKLHRYLEQTAQQGVDSYTGAINTRIMQTFQINTMIMSGSLIETSSIQCRFAINELHGIIDRDEWPELKELAETDGLIEGTTFDNLPFNRLHWGCRHEFTPAVLDEQDRKSLLNSPTNK